MQVLRAAAVPALSRGMWLALLLGGLTAGSAEAQPRPAPPQTVHAFRLYTGRDGNSHVQEGSLPLKRSLPVSDVSFAITPAHAPPVWHNDPKPQYVVTMTGTLKFTTRTHEDFTLRPGDVLLAEDSTGTGHGWTLIGDAPWTRTYAILPEHYVSHFVPSSPAAR